MGRELVWTVYRTESLLRLPGVEPRTSGCPALGLVIMFRERNGLAAMGVCRGSMGWQLETAYDRQRLLHVEIGVVTAAEKVGNPKFPPSEIVSFLHFCVLLS
jgi:hypothetical protein